MSRNWKKAKRVQANRDQAKPFRLCAAGECSISAEPAEGQLGSFEGVAYTGAPMRPGGWWNPVVIDLKGVKVPSQHRPVLRQHDDQQIVGHTKEVTVGQDIRIAGVFSGEKQHTDKVTVPARNGFQWQLSIGADPVRTEYLEAGKSTTVNGRKVSGPLTISRETVLGEISFVPLGADGDTSATVAASRSDAMNPFAAVLKQIMGELRTAGKVQAAKYSDEDIDKMSADDAKCALKDAMKAADEPDADDETEAKAGHTNRLNAAFVRAELDKALKETRTQAAAEAERQAKVGLLCAKYGVSTVEIEVNGKPQQVVLAAHAIAEGWDLGRVEAEAKLHALIKARGDRPGAGVGVPGGLGYATSSPALTEAVVEAAMLDAARHQFKLEDDSFYVEASPDGKQTMRRLPESLQRRTQGEIKARYTDQVRQAAHTLFRGRITPHQMLRAAFRANGHHTDIDLTGEHGVRAALATWDDDDKRTIRAEGASNLSISNILANVMNKFALQGYLFTEQAWREIAGIRNVNDFKPTKSINLLGDVLYKAVGPTGELQNASLGDQAFANQAQPFGRILTLPWTHLVNDDLGMLTGAPQKIGQGAGLALNDYFWALWASLQSGSVITGAPFPSTTNLNGDDGNAFWRTTSSTTAAAKQGGTAYLKNKVSGATTALSTASLQTVKAVFDNQIDPNGNPLGFDGAMPILLFGPSNWLTAAQLMQASYIVMAGLASTSSASIQPNVNIWQGTMKPVMSRYIENASYGNSTTAWWILFNPAALPVIEVAFLNGVDTPAVLQAGPDYQFDRLGISIRGTMPFGVTQQNFRGGVYSAGA